MNLTLSHEAHDHAEPNQRHSAKTRAKRREGAEATLRDIAFVLKMTQKVRDDIDAGKESNELALV